MSIIIQSEPLNPNTYAGVSPVALAPTKIRTNISTNIEKVLVGKGDIVNLSQSFMNRVLRYGVT